MRVSWGRVQNFKCVDYFMIEYWNEEDPDGSFAVSERINRHRTSHDITIKPCRWDPVSLSLLLMPPIVCQELPLQDHRERGLAGGEEGLQSRLRPDQVPGGLCSKVGNTKYIFDQNCDLYYEGISSVDS